MIDPDVFAPYVGFTKEEVQKLCGQYGRDFDEVKRWYDGYLLAGCHVYNPQAVVSVMQRGRFRSYWPLTGTYETILPLINMDFDGLEMALITMISGEKVRVRTVSYQNDMTTFKDKDDILTALIHLGYLTYNEKDHTAAIPNEEIRIEFEEALRETKWNELLEFQKKSEKLVAATLNKESEIVAETIQAIHTEFASAIQYNDENSLSSVLSLAYLGAMQYYFMPIREMPSGKGFADYVFLPKPENIGEIPALVVELKWDKKAETALRQIKERKYVQAIERYTGDMLLVGISYDKKSKKHQCVIEETAVPAL